MRLRLLCVGKPRGALQAAIEEYEKRADRYWRLEVNTVEAGLGKGKKVEERRVRETEEKRLLARLPSGPGETVALTRDGKAIGSRELARFIEERALRSIPEITFIIGGAYGLGEGVLNRSSARLSLSSMTLPHEVARLVLAEQLYRAGTILRNEPYHKGP